MKKKTIKILALIFMSAVLLAGCAGTPEAADDDEILRAKGAFEAAIEDIVNQDGGESVAERDSVEEGAGEKGKGKGDAAGALQSGAQSVNVVLGSGENRMKIQAEISAVPETLTVLTMRADDIMDEDTMRQFLDAQGEVEDITEKLLAEWEAEKQRIAEIDEKLGEGSSIVEVATIGDGSYRALTDGNRKAIFSGNVGGSYEDAALAKKYLAAAREIESEKEVDIRGGDTGDVSFSLQAAKEMLLQKLSVLGINDVNVHEAHLYEKDGDMFYEMRYAPVVDGMSVAYYFGQHEITDIHPDGYAQVCGEGVVRIELTDFCMKQVQAGKENRILGWDKVQAILETYLESGSLQCRENVPFSTVELVWYPEARGKELALVPMWSIHMDLEEYVDYCGESGTDDSMWNIYLNAVTGEIEEVQ